MEIGQIATFPHFHTLNSTEIVTFSVISIRLRQALLMISSRKNPLKDKSGVVIIADYSRDFTVVNDV